MLNQDSKDKYPLLIACDALRQRRLASVNAAGCKCSPTLRPLQSRIGHIGPEYGASARRHAPLTLP